MLHSLVVKVTVDMREAPERCALAFVSAAQAAAAGTVVSFWLAGDASWFALPGRTDGIELPDAAPLAELLGTLTTGSRVTVCKHCANRREITAGALCPGVRMAGAPVFVEECLHATRAVVY